MNTNDKKINPVENSPVAIEIRNLTKRFGATSVLSGINLKIHRGEMVTLLGPSGCGKSTTLNCITGITEPDSGQIIIEGEDVTYKPPHKRDCGLVFQSFALFPHLSVYENIAFPLKIRGVQRDEIHERVMELLQLVGLDKQEKKFPNQLSGGQQQRVGLCRALSHRPRVLLFDEPLSNLDAKLRESMRFEIRDVQRRYGITSIFVTHDQQEALAISDRIAVMDSGRISQFDSPYEVYTKPVTEFVAGFIGLSNLVKGRCNKMQDQEAYIQVGPFEWVVHSTRHISEGCEVVCSVRPKDLMLLKEDIGDSHGQLNVFPCKIDEKTFLGEVFDYRIMLEGYGKLRVLSEADIDLKEGDSAYVQIPQNDCWLIETKN